jgi:NADPH:quinone reductase-like Zn-dependent oxidoreductase
MFAVYAQEANSKDPLAAIVIGERPEPQIPPGWSKVKVTHASLNRHDLFTLMGLSGQTQPTPFPMIMGNDAVGTLEDGTSVIVYPLISSADWHGDETLDPGWHVFSELIPGTMADYVAVPNRNLIARPRRLSEVEAAVLGTAWLTAYRSLFTKSGLQPGQTLLVQGASGGMSTALIQLGIAAGFEVWATTRNDSGAELAQELGAHRVFRSGELLPRKVDSVVNNVGSAAMGHSLASLRRGGTLIVNGVTTGRHTDLDLLPLFVEQIEIKGTLMGTLADMKSMIRFIVKSGVKPLIGAVVPMAEAKDSFRAMLAGATRGKTVFIR